MNRLKIGIVGASGYSGGELLRILLGHPQAEVIQVTSERMQGRPLGLVHPNLRGRTSLCFIPLSALKPCDLLFVCLPHNQSARHFPRLRLLAERIIDLSADFRLPDPQTYERWYGEAHPCPEFLKDFVYGIVELSRDRLSSARYVSGAGCNATAVTLALLPLARAGLLKDTTVICDVKAGTSQGGAAHSEGSHHPARSGSVRSYKAIGHRHSAEIRQNLGCDKIYMSATSLDLVRGVLATCHLELPAGLDEKGLWKLFRQTYQTEPFVRIVKERSGSFRAPDPKILAGTNFCDVGFDIDEREGRLVVTAALDNLVKGAAGQAVQAMNLMLGFEETTGLEFPGLYP
jgi:N-acetyl-gamma-glutamyl-phosphate/LysW-gamma-L-alpha-aminoadipyl-6-phosphate reductase